MKPPKALNEITDAVLRYKPKATTKAKKKRQLKAHKDAAAYLIESVADLQRQVLLKHTTAVLEEIHDQLKARDAMIGELKKAIADLMPILRDWEPDHSTGEERQKWLRAKALLDA